jgi:hypothetical protein
VHATARSWSSSSTSRMVSPAPAGAAAGLALATSAARSVRGRVDLEGGAVTGLAVDHDPAAGLLDDAEHGRQAEAGALTDRLGGEERLEDPGPGRRLHADAGVADRQHHVPAGAGAELGGGVGLVELDVGGLDGQPAAVGHGVAGVDHQVHQHLLELAGIGVDPAEVGRGPHRTQLDVLAQQALEHRPQVGDDLIEVEHPRLQELAAAEREELAGQPGRALAGLLDLARDRRPAGRPAAAAGGRAWRSRSPPTAGC